MVVIETDRGSATFMNTYMENIIFMDKEDVKRYRLKMAQDAFSLIFSNCIKNFSNRRFCRSEISRFFQMESHNFSI